MEIKRREIDNPSGKRNDWMLYNSEIFYQLLFKITALFRYIKVNEKSENAYWNRNNKKNVVFVGKIR